MRLTLIATAFGTAVLSTGALSSTAVAQEFCSLPQEIISVVEASDTAVRRATAIGRSAYACGQPWSAGVAFENAVNVRPTVASRFNLAATYASTERYAAAAALYRSVVEDGAFTRLKLDPPAGNPQGPSLWVNAQDEAAARLERVLARLESDQSPAATGAILDAPTLPDGSRDVETQVDSIVAEARVSGDRALYFDGLGPVPDDLRQFQPAPTAGSATPR